MSRFLVALLCFVAWLSAMVESASRRPRPFQAPAESSAVEKAPVEAPRPHRATPDRISAGSSAPSVHSATAVELPDGRLRAYWFGGTREGSADVAIWSAECEAGVWRAPRVAIDRAGVAAGVRRHLRKLGNPVALAHADGRVTLFVVSVSAGGWSGSAINRLVFSPDGRNVESANRLVASPLLNLGTLVRGAAVETGGGEVLLPAYHETVRKFPVLLRIGRDGRVLGRGGPAVRGELFQPWLLASDAGERDLFLRSGRGNAARIHHSRHDGAGWSEPVPLEIPNPNSAVSSLRLPDGAFLLAANPLPDTRERLALFRAPAPEGPWREILVLDTEAREADEMGEKRVEYSYPWLLLDRAGTVHVFYTWNRREIRHRRIEREEWVLASDPVDRPAAGNAKGGSE